MKHAKLQESIWKLRVLQTGCGSVAFCSCFSAERNCQLSALPCTERAQSHATNANKITKRTKKSYGDVVYCSLYWNNETKFNISQFHFVTQTFEPLTLHITSYTVHYEATDPILCSKSYQDRETLCT